MTTTIRDIDASRKITLEADNPLSPHSVFLEGPNGLCLEFDKGIFINALKREFRNEAREARQLEALARGM